MTTAPTEDLRSRLERVARGAGSGAGGDLRTRLAGMKSILEAPRQPHGEEMDAIAGEPGTVPPAQSADFRVLSPVRGGDLQRPGSRPEAVGTRIDRAVAGVQGLGQTMAAAQPLAPEPGVVGDIGRGLVRGIPVAGQQLGGAMQAVGIPGGEAVADLYGGVAGTIPQPQTTAGSIAQAVPGLIGATGAGVVGGLAAPAIGIGAGAGAIGAAAAAAGAQSGGQQFNDAMTRLGDSPEAESIARTEGLAMGAFSAATSTIPMGRYLARFGGPAVQKALGKLGGNTVFTRLLRDAAAEGGQEAGEELASMVLQRVAEDDPEAFDDFTRRVGVAALGGAALGAAAGGAGELAARGQDGAAGAPRRDLIDRLNSGLKQFDGSVSKSLPDANTSFNGAPTADPFVAAAEQIVHAPAEPGVAAPGPSVQLEEVADEVEARADAGATPRDPQDGAGSGEHGPADQPTAQPPPLDLKAASHSALMTEARRLGVEEGPTNRRALQERISAASAQLDTTAAQVPPEWGVRGTPNPPTDVPDPLASSRDTPVARSAEGVPAPRRIPLESASLDPTSKPMTAMSYRELADEAGRLGVFTEGPQTRRALMDRIERGRQSATEPRPPAAGNFGAKDGLANKLDREAEPGIAAAEARRRGEVDQLSPVQAPAPEAAKDAPESRRVNAVAVDGRQAAKPEPEIVEGRRSQAAPPIANGIAERLTRFADDVETRARTELADIDRRVAEVRRAAKPGTRPGHGAGFDYAVVAAKIAAARAIKAGVKGGRQLAKIVADVLGELKPAVKVRTESVSRLAIGLMRDSRGPDGVIDPDRFESALASVADVRERARPPKVPPGTVSQAAALKGSLKAAERAGTAGYREGVKAGRELAAAPAPETTMETVRRTTGQTDESVRVSERGALKGSMTHAAKAARRAYRAGREDALEEGRLEVESVRQRLMTQRRGQVTAARTIGAMERRAQAGEFKRIQDEQQQARDILTGIVREYLPADLQGRFLGDVARVKTVGQMVRVADRVRDTMAEAQLKDAMRAAVRAQRAVPAKLLTELRKELNEAKAELGRLRGSDGAWRRVTNVTRRDRMSAQLGELRDRFAEIAHRQREFEKVRVAGKVLRREEVVEQGVKSIEKRKEIPFRAQLEETRDSGPIMRARQMLMNPEAIGAATGDKTLRRILSEDFWDGETAVNRDSQAGQDALKASLEKAGYKWGSDELRKLSRAAEGDDATVQVMNLPDAGKVKATPGEWMALYATLDDAKAGANLRSGTPINWSRYPQGRAIKLTPRDLEAMTQQLAPKLRQVVRDAKAFVESEIRPKLFAAFREQKGYDLVEIPGYWRTRRNRQQATGEGIINSTRAQFNKALENLGFLKEREPDTKTPYLIGDFFGDYGEIVHQGATVAHMTRPVRNAELVFKDPRMRTAIESRFGRDMNKRIEGVIENGKLLFGEDPALPDRIMHKLSRNVSRAKLQLNPRSMAKNLGGVFKLAAEMNPRDVLAGLKAAAKPEVRERMMKSAYFRDRYEHAVWARVTPMRDRRTPALGEEGAAGLLKDLVRLKRPRAAVADLIDRIRAYDSIDKLVAATAWAGKEAEATRRGIPEAKRAAWVEREAELVMRRTQNGHSNLERSEVADWASKGGVSSLITPFTSDANKSLNMLLVGASEGREKFRRTAAAVMLNNIWAAAVDTAWKGGLGVAGVALGLAASNRDDRKKSPGHLEEFGWKLLNNNLGMVYGGDLVADYARHIAQAYRGGKAGFVPKFSNPVFSSAQQAAEGLVQLVEAGSQTGRSASGPDRGKSRRQVQFWRGFEKAALGAADLSGIPVSPLWYMYKSATD